MAQLISYRRTGFDVSNRVDVTDPKAVEQEAIGILQAIYPQAHFGYLSACFRDCALLYAGQYPGFQACETPYHNLHHILDVTLATARLIGGHEAACTDVQRFGPQLAGLTVLIALFHDSGYIRRTHDTRHGHGAEYSKVHVGRSARFLEDYLDSIQRPDWIHWARKLVHYTGYEVPLDELSFEKDSLNLLGCILGTADLIAQMSDRVYLEKCRDHLFLEFSLGGMLTRRLADGREEVLYSTPEELLEKTPGFIRHVIQTRLQDKFRGVYRFAGDYFKGPNLYMDAIQKNCEFLSHLLETNQISKLKRDTRI